LIPLENLSTDLKQSDFMMLGVDPIAGRLSHEDHRRTPRTIVIAIDSSGSNGTKLETVRREIGKLIEGLIPAMRWPSSRSAIAIQVARFSPPIIQGLNGDYRCSMPMVQRPCMTRITSVLFAEKGRYQNRALILLTDGMDNVK